MAGVIVALLLLSTYADSVWLIATALAFSTLSMCQVYVQYSRPVTVSVNTVLTVILAFNFVVLHRHSQQGHAYIVLLLSILNPLLASTAVVV